MSSGCCGSCRPPIHPVPTVCVQLLNEHLLSRRLGALQLAEVNTSVASALAEAQVGDARAAKAEEMTVVAQKEVADAERRVRVALGEKRMAELAQAEAIEKSAEASSKTEYLQKQLVQV
eukprot:SAG22_NODE_1648_length_3898_cov_6.783890_2_plen_119_part_00